MNPVQVILGRYAYGTISPAEIDLLQLLCKNHDIASFRRICSAYSTSSFFFYELLAHFSLPVCNEILHRYDYCHISESDILIIVSHAMTDRRQAFDKIASKYCKSTTFLHEMWSHFSTN